MAVPKMVTVCAWCPDSAEQTAAARAHGHEVSHTICATCEPKFIDGESEIDADEREAA